MSKKASNISSSIYVMLGHGATMCFSLVSLLILLRVLPEEIFGSWVLYISLVSFAEMARMGFVQNGFVKYALEAPEAYSRLISSAFILNFLIGLLAWALLGLLSPHLALWWKSPILPELIRWYGLFFLSMSTLRFLEYVQIAKQSFKGLFYSNILYGGLTLLFIVLIVSWKSEIQLPTLIQIQSLAAGISSIIMLFYTRKMVQVGRPSWQWLLRLANYGRYVFGTNLSSMIFQRMDVMMIGFFMNPAAVAYYNLAAKLNNYLEIPLKAIAQVVFPQIAAAHSQKDQRLVKELYQNSVSLLLALILPCFLFLLFSAKWLVVLMGGEQYLEATPVLMILVLTALIKPWGRINGTLMDASGKPQVNFNILLISLILNGILNALLIPILGIIGASIATVSTMLISILVGQYIVGKMIPVSYPHIFRSIPAQYHKALHEVQKFKSKFFSQV